MPWLLDMATWSKSVFGRVLRLFQEFGYCRSIEIEHLGPRQFAFVEVVQSEYLFVQNISFFGASSLTPQHHNIIVVGSHDSGIHFSLCFRGLQRRPRCAPAVRLRFEAAKRSSVRQQARPVDLKVGLKKTPKSRVVSLFD